MKIAVTTVAAPFLSGGAERLADGLVDVLKAQGHEVDLLTTPFRFHPEDDVLRSMAFWEGESMEWVNGVDVDRVICLKFPTYALSHPKKVVWLLHQHRSVYELWGRPGPGGVQPTVEGALLRRQVFDFDQRHLPSSHRLYTISRTVSSRLLAFNRIRSRPLYHPPPMEGRYRTAEPEPFIFFPSRFEDHKRQVLIIRALQHCKQGVSLVLAGSGKDDVVGTLQRHAEALGLGARVRFVGHVTDEQMLDYYARCLAVFFGPLEEDYGYVTLEAMLSAKPVITCSDSGGPLEFVEDGETGFVTDPRPEAIAR
ncbi:MAG: glycosyltransferase family 4 protein, partial [Acidobacteriota bacterium]